MLTEIDGTDITYDEIGNPENWRNATSLTWEGRNLVGATVGNNNYTYTYDSNGIRKQAFLNGKAYKEYVTDGTNIISEIYYGATELEFFYDASGSVSGAKFFNQMYTYRKNLQGDIIGMYNRQGELVVEYTYDAFGNVLSCTGEAAYTVGDINPFLYRGYYFDYDLGLYYLNSRYYDPVVGRFINADSFVSTGQGIIGNNMFAYCLNNPIMASDPSGQIGIILLGLAIGVCSQVVSDLVTSATTGSLEFSSWETYVGSAVGGLVGCVVTPVVGPVYAASIDSAVSTFIGNGLEIAHGKRDDTVGEFVSDVALNATIGAVSEYYIPVDVNSFGLDLHSKLNYSETVDVLCKSANNIITLKSVSEEVCIETIESLPSSYVNGIINAFDNKLNNKTAIIN